MDSIIDWSLDVLEKYRDCSVRHDAVVQAYQNAEEK